MIMDKCVEENGELRYGWYSRVRHCSNESCRKKGENL